MADPINGRHSMHNTIHSMFLLFLSLSLFLFLSSLPLCSCGVVSFSFTPPVSADSPQLNVAAGLSPPSIFFDCGQPVNPGNLFDGSYSSAISVSTSGGVNCAGLRVLTFNLTDAFDISSIGLAIFLGSDLTVTTLVRSMAVQIYSDTYGVWANLHNSIDVVKGFDSPQLFFNGFSTNFTVASTGAGFSSVRGRMIRIAMPATYGNGVDLNLCEVQVWAAACARSTLAGIIDSVYPVNWVASTCPLFVPDGGSCSTACSTTGSSTTPALGTASYTCFSGRLEGNQFCDLNVNTDAAAPNVPSGFNYLWRADWLDGFNRSSQSYNAGQLSTVASANIRQRFQMDKGGIVQPGGAYRCADPLAAPRVLVRTMLPASLSTYSSFYLAPSASDTLPLINVNGSNYQAAQIVNSSPFFLQYPQAADLLYSSIPVSYWSSPVFVFGYFMQQVGTGNGLINPAIVAQSQQPNSQQGIQAYARYTTTADGTLADWTVNGQFASLTGGFTYSLKSLFIESHLRCPNPLYTHAHSYSYDWGTPNQQWLMVSNLTSGVIRTVWRHQRAGGGNVATGLQGRQLVIRFRNSDIAASPSGYLVSHVTIGVRIGNSSDVYADSVVSVNFPGRLWSDSVNISASYIDTAPFPFCFYTRHPDLPLVNMRDVLITFRMYGQVAYYAEPSPVHPVYYVPQPGSINGQPAESPTAAYWSTAAPGAVQTVKSVAAVGVSDIFTLPASVNLAGNCTASTGGFNLLWSTSDYLTNYTLPGTALSVRVPVAGPGLGVVSQRVKLRFQGQSLTGSDYFISDVTIGRQYANTSDVVPASMTPVTFFGGSQGGSRRILVNRGLFIESDPLDFCLHGFNNYFVTFQLYAPAAVAAFVSPTLGRFVLVSDSPGAASQASWAGLSVGAINTVATVALHRVYGFPSMLASCPASAQMATLLFDQSIALARFVNYSRDISASYALSSQILFTIRSSDTIALGSTVVFRFNGLPSQSSPNQALPSIIMNGVSAVVLDPFLSSSPVPASARSITFNGGSSVGIVNPGEFLDSDPIDLCVFSTVAPIAIAFNISSAFVPVIAVGASNFKPAAVGSIFTRRPQSSGAPCGLLFMNTSSSLVYRSSAVTMNIYSYGAFASLWKVVTVNDTNGANILVINLPPDVIQYTIAGTAFSDVSPFTFTVPSSAPSALVVTVMSPVGASSKASYSISLTVQSQFCNALTQPDYGALAYSPRDRSFPATVSVSCVTGAAMAIPALNNSACFSDGTWNASLGSGSAVCVPASCPLPDVYLKMAVQGTSNFSCSAYSNFGLYNYGTVCSNVCKPGYTNASYTDAFIRCQADGTLSGVLAQCMDINECLQSPNPCGPNSACVNFVGSFACHPFIVPNSLIDSPAPPVAPWPVSSSPVRLSYSSVQANRGIAFYVRLSLSPVLTYSPFLVPMSYLKRAASLGVISTSTLAAFAYSCSFYSTDIPLNRSYTTAMLYCQLPLLTGLDLRPALVSCVDNAFGLQSTGLVTVVSNSSTASPVAACALTWSEDAVNLPVPSWVPATLRTTKTAPGIYYSSFTNDNDKLAVLVFNTSNFIFDTNTNHIRVKYGDNLCALDERTTSDLLYCQIAPLGQGSNMKFTVSGPGYSVDSTDTFSYPATPTLISIALVAGLEAGCTPSPPSPDKPYGALTNCPTTGGATVALVGVNYIDQTTMSVFVNGAKCNSLSLKDTNGGTQSAPILNQTSSLTCVLPAGTGLGQSLVVTAVNQFSDQYNVIDYAAPTIKQIQTTNCGEQQPPVSDPFDSVGPYGCCLTSAGSTTLSACSSTLPLLLTISGANFGVSGASVFIGAASCQSVRHDNINPHALLTCVAPVASTGTKPRQVIVIQNNGAPSSMSGLIESAPCPPSTFQVADPGAPVQCMKCPPSTYADKAGLEQCLACLAGSYSLAGQTACAPCPKGRYATQTALTVADSNATDADNIDKQCAVCGLGKYSSAPGALTCQECAAGDYSGVFGAYSCVTARPGYYATCLTNVSGLTNSSIALVLPACAGSNINRLIADADPDGLVRGGYSVLSGANSVAACPAGAANDGPGQVTCSVCRAGQFSVAGSQACSECAPGRFTETSGRSACVDCGAGSYSAAGSSSCLPCADNTFADSAGLSACANCAVGKYSSIYQPDTLVACASCPIGQEGLSVNGVSGGCALCRDGFYSTPSSSCAPCPVGTVSSPANRVFNCTACPPGFYSSQLYSATCTSVPAGLYQPLAGQTSALPCQPGTYNINTGQSACANCSIGTATSGYGQTRCSSCSVGYHAPEEGLVYCQACPKGKYRSDTLNDCEFASVGYETGGVESGAYDELICPPGFYTDKPGETLCMACPVDNYSQYPGSSTCQLCEAGKFQSLTGSSSCASLCTTGQYLAYDVAQKKSYCAPCVTGTACVDGLSILAEEDFYLAFSPQGEALVYPCVLGHCRSCPIELLALNESIADNTLIESRTGARGHVCCASGRVPGPENPMCGQCLPGYSEWGGTCVQCDTIQWGYVFLFVAISWAGVLIFHRISQSSSSDSKLFLYFIQMVFVFFQSTVGWLGWLAIFQFNFSNSTQTLCIAPLTPMDRLLSGIVAPFVCFGELGVTLLIAYGMYELSRRQRPQREEPGALLGAAAVPSSPSARGPHAAAVSVGQPSFNYNPFLRTFTGLLIFSYNSIVDSTLKFFDCILVGDSRVVSSQPAIECDSAEYKTYYFFFLLLLIVAVAGFPVFLALQIIRYRLHLDRLRHRFGILYEGYKKNRAWHESVVLSRRVLLLAVTVAAEGDRISQYSWLTFLNIIILALHFLLWPYENDTHNHIETISLVLLAILTSLLGGMRSPLSLAEATGLGVLIFLPASLMILRIVYLRIKRFQRARAIERGEDPDAAEAAQQRASKEKKRMAAHGRASSFIVQFRGNDDAPASPSGQIAPTGVPGEEVELSPIHVGVGVEAERLADNYAEDVSNFVVNQQRPSAILSESPLVDGPIRRISHPQLAPLSDGVSPVTPASLTGGRYSNLNSLLSRDSADYDGEDIVNDAQLAEQRRTSIVGSQSQRRSISSKSDSGASWPPPPPPMGQRLSLSNGQPPPPSGPRPSFINGQPPPPPRLSFNHGQPPPPSHPPPASSLPRLSVTGPSPANGRRSLSERGPPPSRHRLSQPLIAIADQPEEAEAQPIDDKGQGGDADGATGAGEQTQAQAQQAEEKKSAGNFV